VLLEYGCIRTPRTAQVVSVALAQGHVGVRGVWGPAEDHH
jgi:hypothetical protein